MKYLPILALLSTPAFAQQFGRHHPSGFEIAKRGQLNVGQVQEAIKMLEGLEAASQPEAALLLTTTSKKVGHKVESSEEKKDAKSTCHKKHKKVVHHSKLSQHDTKPSHLASHHTTTSHHETTTTKHKAAVPTTKTTSHPKVVAAEANVPTPTTTSKPVQTSKASSSSPKSSGKGLIGFTSSNCGSSGATPEEPNGSESFLNCGLSKSHPSSGWTPPQGITMDMLASVSLDSAIASNSVWAPCQAYASLFDQHGNANNIPPILLAAFAIQESTCNPSVMGDNGGAVGLMQITVDKCNGLDTKACAEPGFNIGAAASYFKSVIDDVEGDVLTAIAQYNGWYQGMSYNAATAAATSGCCECQQNLDYLYQMLNGWLLGKTGYSMGSLQNLNVCPGN